MHYASGYTSGGEVCEHARVCYLDKGKGPVSDPPIFWKFDASILPQPNAQTPMPTKCDPCHYNIAGMLDEDLSELFKSSSLSDFSICDGEGHRPLRRDDLQCCRCQGCPGRRWRLLDVDGSGCRLQADDRLRSRQARCSLCQRLHAGGCGSARHPRPTDHGLVGRRHHCRDRRSGRTAEAPPRL